MDGEKIGIVLCRASELLSKINNCIDRTMGRNDGGVEEDSDSVDCTEEDDEVGNSLLSIRDALESLEGQLSSLQSLQQRQQYERETTLAEIDHNRRILLKELKKYKGDNMEVILETVAFASGPVDQDDDLLLPPYSGHLQKSVFLDSNYPSYLRNVSVPNLLYNTEEQNGLKDEKDRATSEKPQANGLRGVISLVAKSALTFITILSVMSLAGFQPQLRRRNAQFKPSDLFPKLHRIKENGKPEIKCPPGKVLVIDEEGQPRCLVKERVEVPFEPVNTIPNVSYGCG